AVQELDVVRAERAQRGGRAANERVLDVHTVRLKEVRLQGGVEVDERTPDRAGCHLDRRGRLAGGREVGVAGSGGVRRAGRRARGTGRGRGRGGCARRAGDQGSQDGEAELPVERVTLHNVKTSAPARWPGSYGSTAPAAAWSGRGGRRL